MNIVAHCKERWRNLRACLTRHLKQQNTGATDGSTIHKPYYLAEHMNFLLPYTRSRSSKDQVKYDSPSTDETIANSSVAKLKNDATTTTYTISTSESDEQYVTLIHTSTGELATADSIDETPLKVERSTESEQKPFQESTFTSNNSVIAPKEHLQEIIYESVPAKRIKIPSSDVDDADLEFFRSLLPDIRLMNPSQKRRFKMRVFGLIDNVLSNTDNNNT